MNIKLHASQKTINEDGTTTITFVPILVGGENSILSGGNLTLIIPSAYDAFAVGKDYDGSFAEVV